MTLEGNFGESGKQERDDRDSEELLRAPPSFIKGERDLLSAPKQGPLWLALLDPCGYQAGHIAVVIMEVSCSRPGYRKSSWLCSGAM